MGCLGEKKGDGEGRDMTVEVEGHLTDSVIDRLNQVKEAIMREGINSDKIRRARRDLSKFRRAALHLDIIWRDEGSADTYLEAARAELLVDRDKDKEGDGGYFISAVKKALLDYIKILKFALEEDHTLFYMIYINSIDYVWDLIDALFIYLYCCEGEERE
ncbi:MAG: hypothetical protein DRN78_03600 [Thermoproteota archaeon]|nr:MAG: hypothetical protein DRN78_03600 [Candidatus Korarchaeota archaeon]